MRRRCVTLLAALAVASVLTACGSDATPSANPLPPPTPTGVSATPTPTSTKVTGPIFKVDRESKLIEPTSFSLGDFGAPAMSKLAWSEWSAGKAVGEGTLTQYDCSSTCVTMKSPARITLSGVKKGVFTEMEFTSLSSAKIKPDSYEFNGRVWG